MRVLVTGGGGFAGRHLLRTLTKESPGASLTATVIGDAPSFAPGDPLGRVEWREMNLSSAESIGAVVEETRPHAVYHLAGQASVGRSLQAPVETWEINATGTLRLVQALSEITGGCRLLLVSSAEVYGAGPPGGDPISEDAPVQPITPYGVSKAAAELIALQAGRSGTMEVIIARSFNHIGPGQDERFVLPSIARQIARSDGTGAIQVGNLEVDRDFLDVRDVARAYWLLMEKAVSGGIYNVASGKAVSLHQVVQRLLDLSGSGVGLQVDPERVRRVDIPVLRGDATRLRNLGWAPRIELDATLRDLLESVGSNQ